MNKKVKVYSDSTKTDIALLLARAGIAALMLTHGIPKMLMLFSGGAEQFPQVMGMSAELSLGLTVFAEVICSLLILAGLGTRYATIPLIITMLVAAVLIHAEDPFAMREPAIQYLLVYVVLMFAGSGKYSIDHLLQAKRTKAYYLAKKVKDPGYVINH